MGSYFIYLNKNNNNNKFYYTGYTELHPYTYTLESRLK